MTRDTVPTHDIVTVPTKIGHLVGDRWAADGDARGTVLLLHGGGQRRHAWRRTALRLAAQGWTSFAFDARGHGESTWAADGDYAIDAFVDDLAQITERIGGDAPTLVGASLGGMTSLIGEGERGGLGRGLVLVDIVARPEGAGLRRIREFMASAPEGFADLSSAADAIARYNPNRERSRSAEGLRRNLRQDADGRWRWHWDPAFLRPRSEQDRLADYERARDAARRIRIPTLLVRGGASDIVSDAGLVEMQELIPHAEVATVHGAGHMIAGDDNDVFTARLTSFLGKLDDGPSPLGSRGSRA